MIHHSREVSTAHNQTAAAAMTMVGLQHQCSRYQSVNSKLHSIPFHCIALHSISLQFRRERERESTMCREWGTRCVCTQGSHLIDSFMSQHQEWSVVSAMSEWMDGMGLGWVRCRFVLFYCKLLVLLPALIPEPTSGNHLTHSSHDWLFPMNEWLFVWACMRILNLTENICSHFLLWFLTRSGVTLVE